MPAAAVIPAPIAYIKVVAVKKLVVEDSGRGTRPRVRCPGPLLAKTPCPINLWLGRVASFTVNKLGCLKQAYVWIH